MKQNRVELIENRGDYEPSRSKINSSSPVKPTFCRRVGRRELFRLLFNMTRQAITSKTANGSTNRKSPQEFEAAYIEKFPADRRTLAAELLGTGRASYRLRDDDNIYLGRIETQLMRAEKAARRRIAEKFGNSPATLETADLSLGLTDPDYAPAEPVPGRPRDVRTRQLSGQPTSPGIVDRIPPGAVVTVDGYPGLVTVTT